MKRMRIPMSVALGAALSLTPLSFVSAKENPAPSKLGSANIRCLSKRCRIKH